MSIVSGVTEFLVDTCKRGGHDLVLVAQVLDTFYDIFAEANYNVVLAEQKVIEMM
jgi:hypothetical protein